MKCDHNNSPMYARGLITSFLTTETHLISFLTDNQVDGECFLELSESDVKEIVKPLGIVKKILRLIREVK